MVKIEEKSFDEKCSSSVEIETHEEKSSEYFGFKGVYTLYTKKVFLFWKKMRRWINIFIKKKSERRKFRMMFFVKVLPRGVYVIESSFESYVIDFFTKNFYIYEKEEDLDISKSLTLSKKEFLEKIMKIGDYRLEKGLEFILGEEEEEYFVYADSGKKDQFLYL